MQIIGISQSTENQPLGLTSSPAEQTHSVHTCHSHHVSRRQRFSGLRMVLSVHSTVPYCTLGTVHCTLGLESSERYGRLIHEWARLTKERPSRSGAYAYGIEQIALGARQGSDIERRPPRVDAGEGTVTPLGIETYFGRCGIGELAKTSSSEPFAKPARPTSSMPHAE